MKGKRILIIYLVKQILKIFINKKAIPNFGMAYFALMENI